MEKGQIFSLDFMISMVAVTLAIGLIIQAVEVNTYSQKEERQFDEIKLIAENAGNMLVSNPDIVCEMVDEDNDKDAKDGKPYDIITYVHGCIPRIVLSGEKAPGAACETHGNSTSTPSSCREAGGLKPIYKDNLGIPDGFNCNTIIQGIASSNEDLFFLECHDDPTGVKNIYSAARQVIVYRDRDEATVLKAELEDCMTGSCNKFETATVTIQVWRA